jgi:hypothetical protein
MKPSTALALRHGFLCGFLVFLGFLTLPSASAGDANPPPYHGEAYGLNPQNPELLYTESHQEYFLNGRKTGIYTCFQDPQGQVLAERHLDFSRSAVKPDYIFKDFRHGYEEGAKVAGNQVNVFFRASLGSPLHEKVLKVPEPFVIDGGFNDFLRQNWDSLMTGHRIHFHFVAPARLDYFGFVAHEDPQRVPKGKTGGNARAAKAIVVEVDNALLRLLVSPIVILYDSSTRKMMQYQGISNISDAKGKSLMVRILYPETGP